MRKIRRLREQTEQSLEDMARAIPDSSPLKGPNGNVIIHREWRSTPGERFSYHEGGLVSTLVSDWDNAEECAYCGREIVHVYYVYDVQKDEVLPYGKNHAHLALGYDEPLKRRQLTRIEAEIQDFNRQKEGRKENVVKSLSSDWEQIRSSTVMRGFNLPKLAQEGFAFFWSEERQEGIIYSLNWGKNDPVWDAIMYDLQLERIEMSGLRELREFLESRGIAT